MLPRTEHKITELKNSLRVVNDPEAVQTVDKVQVSITKLGLFSYVGK